MKNKISFTIEIIFLFLGMFAFSVIMHEGYHYFSIDSEPVGFCFGRCDLQGNYDDLDIGGLSWAAAYIRWEDFPDGMDRLKEERNAWIFSLGSLFLLVALMLNNGNKL